MILFADWRIQADGEVIARQYDNLSRSIVIVGSIPDGYTWDLLVQAGHNLNIICLSEMDGGIGVVLTAQMLAVSGNYTMQLRGTLQADGGQTYTVTMPGKFTQEASAGEFVTYFDTDYSVTTTGIKTATTNQVVPYRSTFAVRTFVMPAEDVVISFE